MAKYLIVVLLAVLLVHCLASDSVDNPSLGNQPQPPISDNARSLREALKQLEAGQKENPSPSDEIILGGFGSYDRGLLRASQAETGQTSPQRKERSKSFPPRLQRDILAPVALGRIERSKSAPPQVQLW